MRIVNETRFSVLILINLIKIIYGLFIIHDAFPFNEYFCSIVFSLLTMDLTQAIMYAIILDYYVMHYHAHFVF